MSTGEHSGLERPFPIERDLETLEADCRRVAGSSVHEAVFKGMKRRALALIEEGQTSPILTCTAFKVAGEVIEAIRPLKAVNLTPGEDLVADKHRDVPGAIQKLADQIAPLRKGLKAHLDGLLEEGI